MMGSRTTTTLKNTIRSKNKVARTKFSTAPRKPKRRKINELERLEIDKDLSATQGFNNEWHGCTECFAEFNCELQLRSHQTAFHSEGLCQFGYRCSICHVLFSQLELFIHHRACKDKRKRRLAVDGSCVCLLCGCASLRPHLAAHLDTDHDWQIDLIQVEEHDEVLYCNLCSPYFPCNSKTDLLVHLSSWHSNAISIESVDNSRLQPCRLCDKSFSESEFRGHVLNAHCVSNPEDAVDSRDLSIPRGPDAGGLENVPQTAILPLPRPTVRKKPPRVQKAKKSFRPPTLRSSPEKQPAAPEPRDNNGDLSKEEEETSSSLTCNNCFADFDRPEQLSLHMVMRMCHTTTTLSCPFCHQTMHNWQLWLHIIADHKNKEQLGIAVTQKMLSLLTCGMEEGRKSPEPSHPCQFCALNFTNDAVHRIHTVLFHKSLDVALPPATNATQTPKVSSLVAKMLTRTQW